MVRLTHFVTHPIQYFAPLYRALAGHPDIQLTVLFGSRHGTRPSFDEGFGQTIQFDVPLLEGYTYHFLENRGSGVPKGDFGSFDCPRVAEWLLPEKTDVLWVHGWGYKAQRQALKAAYKAGIPYLVRGETTLVGAPKYSLRWLARKWSAGKLLRRAAGCLCLGRQNRAFYESLGVPASRLFPAHYSIDTRKFQAHAGSALDRQALRGRYGVGPDEMVVTTAAKLIARKCVGDVVRAVSGAGENTRLWVLGDGTRRQELESLARAAAPGRVEWFGFVNQSQMPALYGASDVFVLASSDEPWGLAVNEAMACGLPAVCSNRVGCASDLVLEGQTGFTYPAGDVPELSRRLAALARDGGLRQRLGRQAQERVLGLYDVSTTASQIADAVTRVARRARPCVVR